MTVAAVPMRPLALALALASAFTMGCGSSAESSANGACADFRFDRERWDAARTNGDPGNASHAIARKLVRCRRLIGQTRNELREMLGRPNDRTKSDLGWGLGQEESMFPVDELYLYVSFDSAGRAKQANVGQG